MNSTTRIKEVFKQTYNHHFHWWTVFLDDRVNAQAFHWLSVWFSGLQLWLACVWSQFVWHQCWGVNVWAQGWVCVNGRVEDDRPEWERDKSFTTPCLSWEAQRLTPLLTHVPDYDDKLLPKAIHSHVNSLQYFNWVVLYLAINGDPRLLLDLLAKRWCCKR